MEPSVVARLLEQTARAVYESRGPNAIQPEHWAALRYLALAGRNARTIGGIAIYLNVTHVLASRWVAELARRGLVVVRTEIDSRRFRRVELTATGRALLEHDPVLRLREAIETLPSASQTEFATTLERVLDKLVIRR